jgi:hypothetical protein
MFRLMPRHLLLSGLLVLGLSLLVSLAFAAGPPAARPAAPTAVEATKPGATAPATSVGPLATPTRPTPTPSATPQPIWAIRGYLPLVRRDFVPTATPTPPPTRTPTPTIVPRCLLLDGGFEAGYPNPYWIDGSTNFGTPLCTVARCGGGSPHSGQWWAWFGGIDRYEYGYLNQTVTIPPSTAILTYWLKIPYAGGSSDDYLQVVLSGSVLARYTPASQPNFQEYTLVTHNISAQAFGWPRTLAFQSTVWGPGVSNFFIDDVNICIH